MSRNETPADGVSATAEVVRGGNRRYRIAVPVVIRDRNGDPWWEGEAVASLDLPAGAPVPRVEVPIDTSPRVREVPREG